MVPGVVLPAKLAYRALLEALGDGVEAVAKELELYAGEGPSPGYALYVEIEGILRAAEASGFDRFHLVGYSGGGAVALAFAADHSQRLRSLALLEPAWAGNKGLDRAEKRYGASTTGSWPSRLRTGCRRSCVRISGPVWSHPRHRRDRRRLGWRNGRQG